MSKNLESNPQELAVTFANPFEVAEPEPIALNGRRPEAAARFVQPVETHEDGHIPHQRTNEDAVATTQTTEAPAQDAHAVRKAPKPSTTNEQIKHLVNVDDNGRAHWDGGIKTKDGKKTGSLSGKFMDEGHLEVIKANQGFIDKHANDDRMGRTAADEVLEAFAKLSPEDRARKAAADKAYNDTYTQLEEKFRRNGFSEAESRAAIRAAASVAAYEAEHGPLIPQTESVADRDYPSPRARFQNATETTAEHPAVPTRGNTGTLYASANARNGLYQSANAYSDNGQDTGNDDSRDSSVVRHRATSNHGKHRAKDLRPEGVSKKVWNSLTPAERAVEAAGNGTDRKVDAHRRNRTAALLGAGAVAAAAGRKAGSKLSDKAKDVKDDLVNRTGRHGRHIPEKFARTREFGRKAAEKLRKRKLAAGLTAASLLLAGGGLALAHNNSGDKEVPGKGRPAVTHVTKPRVAVQPATHKAARPHLAPLPHGGSVWADVEQATHGNITDTPQERKLVGDILKTNGQTWESARHLPDGWTPAISLAELHAIQQAANQDNHHHNQDQEKNQSKTRAI